MLATQVSAHQSDERFGQRWWIKEEKIDTSELVESTEREPKKQYLM